MLVAVKEGKKGFKRVMVMFHHEWRRGIVSVSTANVFAFISWGIYVKPLKRDGSSVSTSEQIHHHAPHCERSEIEMKRTSGLTKRLTLSVPSSPSLCWLPLSALPFRSAWAAKPLKKKKK